jgi:undecaprenyl pyrophosphate phosphatase UppP
MFVTSFLFMMLFSFIISIDVIMGTKISELLRKETNPFQVMEPSEYGIIFVFGLSLVVNVVSALLKRKKKNSSQG